MEEITTPLRFDLINNIFSSWSKTIKALTESPRHITPPLDISTIFPECANKEYVLYKHDDTIFSSTILITKRTVGKLNGAPNTPDGVLYTLHIKLSNNDVLYPEEYLDRRVYDRKDKPFAECWFELSQTEIMQCRPLYEFACAWVGKSEPNVLAFYNASNNRLEYKCFNNKAGLEVFITFKAGCSSDWNYDHLWIEL